MTAAVSAIASVVGVYEVDPPVSRKIAARSLTYVLVSARRPGGFRAWQVQGFGEADQERPIVRTLLPALLVLPEGHELLSFAAAPQSAIAASCGRPAHVVKGSGSRRKTVEIPPGIRPPNRGLSPRLRLVPGASRRAGRTDGQPCASHGAI